MNSRRFSDFNQGLIEQLNTNGLSTSGFFTLMLS